MSKTVLSIRQISKFYPSIAGNAGHQALDNVTFDIQAGDIFGIIGTSGAGKSTLMRCLLGLEKPSSGSALFHEKSIAEMNADELRAYRRRIGMVFQHFNLLPARSVIQNICYPMEIAGVPLEERLKRAKELLELVGLSKKADEYPSCLSGGEKQRVGIARALANNPEVLFCDEATSALDPGTIAGILGLLQDLNRQLGLTIVVITHQFDVVKQLCSHVGVLLNGQLVEQGSVTDLFNNPKHPGTAELLGSQLPPLPEGICKTRNLYRLRFKGDQAKEPVIARMLKQFEVDVNILQANIDSFQHSYYGLLVIELIGHQTERQKALDYLSVSRIACEEL